MADFQVYIIESPAPEDVYERWGEGEMIRESLRLADIPATVRVALDEEHFVKALREGLSELMQKKNLMPVLHVSAHGNEKGIELSDGRFIEWSLFGQITASLNGHLGGELLVCVSSCNSFNCARHALSGTNPWKVIVGNTGEPTWNDTIIAFSAFYHLLAKGKTIQEAVQGMCTASGNSDFKSADAQAVRAVNEKLAILPPERRERIARAIAEMIK